MDFSPPGKRRSVLINVTSLIDVMFLLVLFFMLSSTFKNQPAINLILPRSSTAKETPQTPAVIYLTASGQVYLNDRALANDQVVAALRQLQAGTGDDRIVLRADENATHGAVVALIDLIKESGFTRVSLSARPTTGP
jgi:biopolymer transport protein ExbD